MTKTLNDRLDSLRRAFDANLLGKKEYILLKETVVWFYCTQLTEVN